MRCITWYRCRRQRLVTCTHDWISWTEVCLCKICSPAYNNHGDICKLGGLAVYENGKSRGLDSLTNIWGIFTGNEIGLDIHFENLLWIKNFNLNIEESVVLRTTLQSKSWKVNSVRDRRASLFWSGSYESSEEELTYVLMGRRVYGSSIRAERGSNIEGYLETELFV